MYKSEYILVLFAVPIAVHSAINVGCYPRIESIVHGIGLCFCTCSKQILSNKKGKLIVMFQTIICRSPRKNNSRKFWMVFIDIKK